MARQARKDPQGRSTVVEEGPQVDVAMNINHRRVDRKRAELENLHEKVVGRCKDCGGTGIVYRDDAEQYGLQSYFEDCHCMRLFRALFEIVTGDVPSSFRYIFKKKLWPRKVLEVEVPSGVAGKIPQELTKCVYSCVEAVEHIIPTTAHSLISAFSSGARCKHGGFSAEST